jgi:hypothetical protein
MTAKGGILEAVKTNGKIASFWADEVARATEPDTARLACLIAAYALTTAVLSCPSLAFVSFHTSAQD